MTPTEFAAAHRVDAKQVRRYLRREFARSAVEHGQRWEMTPEMVQAARSYFGRRVVSIESFEQP